MRSATPHDKYPAVIVRGADFTFRTLHADDGPGWSRHRQEQYSLDRVVTFTLPAIAGLYHCEPATCEVVL